MYRYLFELTSQHVNKFWKNCLFIFALLCYANAPDFQQIIITKQLCVFGTSCFLFVSGFCKCLKIQSERVPLMQWAVQRSSSFHYLMQRDRVSCQGLQHEFRVAQFGLKKKSRRRAACMIHCVHLPIMTVSEHFKQWAEVFRGKAIFYWTLKAPGGSIGCFGSFHSPSFLSFTFIPVGQLLPIVLLRLGDNFYPAGTVPRCLA